MPRSASLILGISLCAVAPVISVEDSSALVQETVQAHHQQASSSQARLGRTEILASIAAEQWPQLKQPQASPSAPSDAAQPAFKLPELKLPELKLPKLDLPALMDKMPEWAKPFDCGAHPLLCKPPFDCQTWNAGEFAKTLESGMAADGKANLRMWCKFPDYDKYIDACLVQKDLVKAAHVQFAWATEQQNGVDAMDGSYCFIEGHCTNTAVTNETRLEDAYEMCDDRYQRKHWAEFGSLAYQLWSAEVDASMSKNWGQGIKDPRTSRYFAKAACAMGNFHCDVMYCKETYCKDPKYIRRFGHLLPKAPGHLLQFRGKIEVE